MDPAARTAVLRESRLNLYRELNTHVDACRQRHPRQDMNGEERATYERISARIDGLDDEIRRLAYEEMSERDNGLAREGLYRAAGSQRLGMEAERRDAQIAVDFFLAARGDTEHGEFDAEGGRYVLRLPVGPARRELELLRGGADPLAARALAWDTGSVASAVPTGLARSVYMSMEASTGMLQAPTTRLNTTTGAAINQPTTTTHGAATQVSGQGTAIGGTDPVFGALRLDAYKYAEYVTAADEVLQDTNPIDIVSFLGRDIGRAIGRVIGADLSVGSGSDEPRGLMVALAGGGAGSVTTGGSLIQPSYENVVDTMFTVNDGHRGPESGWLMKDTTTQYLRKLRDGAGGTEGAFLWDASLTAGLPYGQPDRLLGYPVYTDPSVAGLGSNARALAFVDFASYYVRTVGDVLVERGRGPGFSLDTSSFRGKWRVDGDLIDVAAGASLVQNV